MMDGIKNNGRTTDRTGQQLGNYELLLLLERTKFSRVYLGEHIQFKTQHIIRTWQVSLAEELPGNFLRQTQTLAQLEHPHILRVRDAGVENFFPFVVMDYVPHVTLQQHGRLQEIAPTGGTLQSLTDILFYLKPIAEALQYAHNRHVLHKNIRPRNILLTQNNSILLSNFTIDAVAQSKQLDVLTAEEVTENLGYMAPEQIEGKPVPASDQYALAVIVYQWLCGTLPFRGSYSEIVNSHLHIQPPSLCQRVPIVSRAVEEVVFTALAKDPKKRFPNALMLVDALQQAQRPGRVQGPGRVQDPPLPYYGQQSAQPAQVVPDVPVSSVPSQGPAVPQAQAVRPTSPSVAANNHSSPPKAKDKASISRRVFVAGLVGVAVLGGGGTWFVLSQKLSTPSFGPGSPSTSASPTVNPDTQSQQGTILIYRAHPARVSAVAWSPDGKQIASASDDHLVQICDAKSGKTILTYRGHSAEVYAVAWSHDGKYIASAGADKTVRVWDAGTGQTVRMYTGHTEQVNAVDWSPDSKLIASGSDDHTVQVWNILNGEVAMIYSEHTAGVLTVAWSPDNTRIASGSWDTTVKAFSTIQTESFAIGGTVFDYRGHRAEVYSVAWSPDGNRIASASADKVVQVGNGSNGATLFTYAGHSGLVYSVAWSPDGKFLASASSDTTVQVWSADATQKLMRQRLFSYHGHSNAVYTVAWAPARNVGAGLAPARLASGSSDNTMQVWRLV